MIDADVRAQLPRSDDVPHPIRWLLYRFRWIGQWGIRRRYTVRVHGTENVPRTGPVIMASNHVGVMDGPLLAIYSPRPVHALTKSEMFEHGFLGRFLLLVGQIPLHRTFSDPTAVKTALHVLRTGRVMGIYPEGARGSGEFERWHRGAAYFALASGAPVVPVVMFGTRDPGGSVSSLPHKRAEIDIVYGEPIRVDPVPWPRTREQVEQVSKLLQEHMQVHLDRAKALTGRTLPGPPPDPIDEENE
ncbi:lysophospholipid acyltransferase family protein [Nocardioides sp. KR10-350]|uniref:lysophospholipid acyltransferase family protein n=1 Tax=Nocardioides cheoyonin TaxID=3156615 RepID=UPI0032B3DE5E